MTQVQHEGGHDIHGISSNADLEACHCVSVVGSSSSNSSTSSACSSVLWLLRAYMTRIADISHNIASFTVSQYPLLEFNIMFQLTQYLLLLNVNS